MGKKNEVQCYIEYVMLIPLHRWLEHLSIIKFWAKKLPGLEKCRRWSGREDVET